MKPTALLFSLMLLPFSIPTRAQSARIDTVSVGELQMSAKAVRAFTKGSELLAHGDAAASVDYLRKAIELAPANFHPYHNLGLAYFQLGQRDCAAAAFQKAVELTRRAYAPSLFGLAMIFYQRSDYSGAKVLVEQGLTVEPSSEVGKYCLGLVQFSMGDLVGAERSALEAVSRGNESDAYVLLGHVHERTGRPEAVVSDVANYLKMEPNGMLRVDAMALLQRARMQMSSQVAVVR